MNRGYRGSGKEEEKSKKKKRMSKRKTRDDERRTRSVRKKVGEWPDKERRRASRRGERPTETNNIPCVISSTLKYGRQQQGGPSPSWFILHRTG